MTNNQKIILMLNTFIHYSILAPTQEDITRHHELNGTMSPHNTSNQDMDTLSNISGIHPDQTAAAYDSDLQPIHAALDQITSPNPRAAAADISLSESIPDVDTTLTYQAKTNLSLQSDPNTTITELTRFNHVNTLPPVQRTPKNLQELVDDFIFQGYIMINGHSADLLDVKYQLYALANHDKTAFKNAIEKTQKFDMYNIFQRMESNLILFNFYISYLDSSRQELSDEDLHILIDYLHETLNSQLGIKEAKRVYESRANLSHTDNTIMVNGLSEDIKNKIASYLFTLSYIYKFQAYLLELQEKNNKVYSYTDEKVMFIDYLNTQNLPDKHVKIILHIIGNLTDFNLMKKLLAEKIEEKIVTETGDTRSLQAFIADIRNENIQVLNPSLIKQTLDILESLGVRAYITDDVLIKLKTYRDPTQIAATKTIFEKYFTPELTQEVINNLEQFSIVASDWNSATIDTLNKMLDKLGSVSKKDKKELSDEQKNQLTELIANNLKNASAATYLPQIKTLLDKMNALELYVFSDEMIESVKTLISKNESIYELEELREQLGSFDVFVLHNTVYKAILPNIQAQIEKISQK